MSSFSGQVSQAGDNCIQQSAWNGSGPCSTNNTTTGAFAPGTVEACAQRFNNVTIPNGATITAASLNLYVASTKGAAAGSGTLDCEAADNAAGFGASPANGLLYGLPLTGHGSTWSFPAESSTGFVTTADFSAAIQAVVNRPGWASGNSIVVLLYNPSSGCDINFEQYDGTASEAPELNITYTAGSPPGTPTGLTATAVDYQSVALGFTQGSGSVTDNKIQYSTDDATWTTIDAGSAVTSYTVTGLSQNTPYYFRVAAQNTSGLSSYTSAVTATTYKAWNIQPVSDVSTTGWTSTGPNCYSQLTDGSDSTYISAPVTSEVELGIGSVPSDFTTAVAISVTIRGKASASESGTFTPVFYGSGATLLSSPFGINVPNTFLTTSFANYTGNPGLHSGVTQNAAAWTGAYFAVVTQEGSVTFYISELSGVVSYLPAIIDDGNCGWGQTLQVADQVCVESYQSTPVCHD